MLQVDQVCCYTVVCTDGTAEGNWRTIHSATRRFDNYNSALEYACQRWGGGDDVAIFDDAGSQVYAR